LPWEFYTPKNGDILIGFRRRKGIPMKLNLIALKNRCLRAQRRGWIISSASQLVADLEKKLGSKLSLPRRVKAGSPAHLVALIEALQAGVQVEEPVIEPTPEPEPEEELVEVELADEPEPEEGEEVELANEPEAEEGEELEILTYGEMTYQQLVDEAQNRGLPGRRGTSKVELLEMLEKD
jgi:hypothetical protein